MHLKLEIQTIEKRYDKEYKYAVLTNHWLATNQLATEGAATSRLDLGFM